MRFSIIVPVHNTDRYLARCLRSLLDQDYPRGEFEILCVDNLSTDGSRDILLACDGIRCLTEPAAGAYRARNSAISRATGDILAFTDSDCYPDPGWLSAIDRAFRQRQVQVVLGRRRPIRDAGLLRLIADYEGNKDEFVLGSSVPELCYGFTNNMAVRRSTMERYGPFVERPRGSDTVFVRRVADGEGCGALVYEPSMLVIHGELDAAAAYFRKMRIYGRSRREYAHLVHTRPLSTRERLRVLTATVRAGRYTVLQIVALAAGLVVGLVAWSVGSLSPRSVR